MKKLNHGMHYFFVYMENKNPFVDSNITEMIHSVGHSSAKEVLNSTRRIIIDKAILKFGIVDRTINKITLNNLKRDETSENNRVFRTTFGYTTHKYVWVCNLKIKTNREEINTRIFIATDE